MSKRLCLFALCVLPTCAFHVDAFGDDEFTLGGKVYACHQTNLFETQKNADCGHKLQTRGTAKLDGTDYVNTEFECKCGNSDYWYSLGTNWCDDALIKDFAGRPNLEFAVKDEDGLKHTEMNVAYRAGCLTNYCKSGTWDATSKACVESSASTSTNTSNDSDKSKTETKKDAKKETKKETKTNTKKNTKKETKSNDYGGRTSTEGMACYKLGSFTKYNEVTGVCTCVNPDYEFKIVDAAAAQGVCVPRTSNNKASGKSGKGKDATDDIGSVTGCYSHNNYNNGTFEIYFEVNKTKISDASCVAKIKEKVGAALAKVNKKNCVYMIGYADPLNKTGRADNDKLSRERAAYIRSLFPQHSDKFGELRAGGDATQSGIPNAKKTKMDDERRVDIIYGGCVPQGPTKLELAKKDCEKLIKKGLKVEWSATAQKCVCKDPNKYLTESNTCEDTPAYLYELDQQRKESRVKIIAAAKVMDGIAESFKISVWKNQDGGFNTARLASDGIAGVALGTVGGLITSNVIKKNQIKGGFEDIKCSIGGQIVADWGDDFEVGIR